MITNASQVHNNLQNAEVISKSGWHDCQFLTCSVLPVRMACNLKCPFCFSKSSVSSLKAETANWSKLHVERYYDYCKERGATRLVVTGGGEPLLRPNDVLSLIERGSSFFDEIALFTNGTFLTRDLARQLRDVGLSYLCYSRHHHNDDQCRQLMGAGTPRLDDFCLDAEGLPIRATCVMASGWIDSTSLVDQYIERLSANGIRQFTFKHTYVAYSLSLFGSSAANQWSREHQVESDPFHGRGRIVARLPWGPYIRRINSTQVCYYFEPTPSWELENRLCRSANLLSDGTVFASLEDQQSQLFRLNCS